MFKRSAEKLTKLIGVSVETAKPDKKGSFRVLVGGKAVIDLLAMPRPFRQLRELDMDDAAKKIKAALK